MLQENRNTTVLKYKIFFSILIFDISWNINFNFNTLFGVVQLKRQKLFFVNDKIDKFFLNITWFLTQYLRQTGIG